MEESKDLLLDGSRIDTKIFRSAEEDMAVVQLDILLVS
jgi:hypothetical protein